MTSHLNPILRSGSSPNYTDVKDVMYYINGITNGDQFILSESITLLESTVKEHRDIALQLLEYCFQQDRSTIRIGITGSPGVGKSTFIESICTDLFNENELIGILTIDPSSTQNKGSILGDKTRMDSLVSQNNIFIRPSPSSHHLGGLNQKTLEAIILCEAAGYTNIFIETVGVGQSESEVSSCTDITILLVMPGAGDSLQGIKKGVVENADLIIVHKADGATKSSADVAVREFSEAVHFSEKSKNILPYSSVAEENKQKVISAIKSLIPPEKDLYKKRNAQMTKWLYEELVTHYRLLLEEKLAALKSTIESEKLSANSPFTAFNQLIRKIAIDLEIVKE